MRWPVWRFVPHCVHIIASGSTPAPQLWQILPSADGGGGNGGGAVDPIDNRGGGGGVPGSCGTIIFALQAGHEISMPE